MKKMLRERMLVKKSENLSEQIEDWIRLKQYVDLLPFEYTYSFECDYSSETSDFESRVFIHVGDKHWVGSAYGYSEYASLAESLRRIHPTDTTAEDRDLSASPQFQRVSMEIPH